MYFHLLEAKTSFLSERRLRSGGREKSWARESMSALGQGYRVTLGKSWAWAVRTTLCCEQKLSFRKSTWCHLLLVLLMLFLTFLAFKPYIDVWMASPTRWTWVWVNSGSWWWTGRPGVLQFMGSQRVGHDWATELNWNHIFVLVLYKH